MEAVMNPYRALRTTILALLLLASVAGTGDVHAQVPPGGCTEPASKHAGEIGCYLSADESLGVLPQSPLFWHLYQYPTRDAATAAKGKHGTVGQSFQKIWLYTIAERDWRPRSGKHIATIGPLAIKSDRQYTARYLEATFTPDMTAATHRHSGPEAWYLVSGAQCVETPDGITILRTGEGGVVPEGPPMALSSVGSETRRSIALVLHDTTLPWSTLAHDWAPKGKCPKQDQSVGRPLG